MWWRGRSVLFASQQLVESAITLTVCSGCSPYEGAGTCKVQSYSLFVLVDVNVKPHRT